MAATPIWKIYDHDETYQASCHEAEAAAALIAFYGPSATIRYAHGPEVWREGAEIAPAAESYDTVAATCLRRRALWEEALSQYGRPAKIVYRELVALDRAAALGAGLAEAGL